MLILTNCSGSGDKLNNRYVNNYVVQNRDGEIKANFELVIWGISGNHYEINLSPEKIESYDSLKHYKFVGELPMFYKYYRDTLFIYTSNLVERPENDQFEIVIQQLLLTKTKYDSLENLGFTKIDYPNK